MATSSSQSSWWQFFGTNAFVTGSFAAKQRLKLFSPKGVS
jgi:hypothetical protein